MIIYDSSFLPAEVMEKVFSYLGERDIVAAACVCTHWAGVCQRVARHRCWEIIPDDILTELLSEQEWDQTDWVEVWSAWVGSGIVPGMEVGEQGVEHRITYSSPVRVSMVEGDGVYTGDEHGNLEWRQVGYNRNIRTQLRDGSVENIVLIPSYGLVLVAGQTKLHIFYLDRENYLWEELSTDICLSLGSNHHLSVFGPRFSAANTEGFVQVFEMCDVSTGSVLTSVVCTLVQTVPWVQWTLWREKCIVLQSNGEILVFSLLDPTGQLMYKSEAYTVVMYKNPCWIFRDVVFCSSLASRGFLDSNYGPHTYVYMSDLWETRNGTGYWMVGPVDDLSDRTFLEESDPQDVGQVITANTDPQVFASLMRGFCLKKIYPGLNSNDDVTCITMKRRLILCGTRSGALLIFSADGDEATSDTQTTGAKKYVRRKSPTSLRHSKLEFDSKPLAKMMVAMSAISKVDIGFTNSSILLYYKVSKSMDCMSCITLPSLLTYPCKLDCTRNVIDSDPLTLT